jgi:hypothetical protein
MKPQQNGDKRGNQMSNAQLVSDYRTADKDIASSVTNI